jgi:cytochrome c
VVKAKGCLNCHDVDKPKIGPSFRDVAAKYRNSKEAPAALAAKLEEGKGHMKVDASAAELAAAIQLVLSAK